MKNNLTSKKSPKRRIKFSAFDKGLEKDLALRNIGKEVVALASSSSAMISRGKEE
jgi:hypothetical protein